MALALNIRDSCSPHPPFISLILGTLFLDTASTRARPAVFGPKWVAVNSAVHKQCMFASACIMLANHDTVPRYFLNLHMRQLFEHLVGLA